MTKTDAEMAAQLLREASEKVSAASRLLPSTLAGGAPSAPAEIDPWEGINLRKDTFTVGEAALEARCDEKAVRNRIDEETREINLTGGQRKFARMILGKWRILKRELNVHTPRKKHPKKSKDLQSTDGL